MAYRKLYAIYSFEGESSTCRKNKKEKKKRATYRLVKASPSSMQTKNAPAFPKRLKVQSPGSGRRHYPVRVLPSSHGLESCCHLLVLSSTPKTERNGLLILSRTFLGVCTHPYTGARVHVSNTRQVCMHAHTFLRPVDSSANLLLFISDFLCVFFCM